MENHSLAWWIAIFVIWEVLAAPCHRVDWGCYWQKERRKLMHRGEDRGTMCMCVLVSFELSR